MRWLNVQFWLCKCWARVTFSWRAKRAGALGWVPIHNSEKNILFESLNSNVYPSRYQHKVSMDQWQLLQRQAAIIEKQNENIICTTPRAMYLCYSRRVANLSPGVVLSNRSDLYNWWRGSSHAMSLLWTWVIGSIFKNSIHCSVSYETTKTNPSICTKGEEGLGNASHSKLACAVDGTSIALFRSSYYWDRYFLNTNILSTKYPMQTIRAPARAFTYQG